MFVSAGSASTQATSPWASSRSSASTSFHSTTRVVSSRGTGGPRLPSAARRSRAVERRERLVDRAVVAPVEDEYLRPPGDVAREADGESVRVGRRQRELPPRQAEAPRRAPRRPRARPRSGASRDPARRLLGDRAHGRLGRVACHRARVAEAEVDVLDARRRRGSARRGLDREHREAAGPAHHPVHRHAARSFAFAPLRAPASADAPARSARARRSAAARCSRLRVNHRNPQRPGFNQGAAS